MRKLTLALALSFLFSISAMADNIFLKDGSQIKGKITQVNNGDITVQTDYGTMVVPKAKVLNVIYDDSNNQNDEDQPKKEKKKKKKESKDADLSEPESWYMNIFLGVGSMKEKDDLRKLVDSYSYVNSTDFEKKTLGHLNLGFYGTINSHVLLGGSFSVMISAWEEHDAGTKKFSIMATMLHLDLKVFFNEICNGFFINIAPGIGTISFTAEGDGIQKEELESKAAVGIKGGLGYAFELNRFNNAFIIGVDGFYISGKYDNKTTHHDDKWTLSGAYFYLGWLW